MVVNFATFLMPSGGFATKGDGSVLYLSDFINYLVTVSKVQNRTVPFCPLGATGNLFLHLFSLGF